ncbi:MAG TPA: hypothetical protein VN729_12940 [Ktedonobacteraceae bacterium]|nr:hypothetical protein [Ktedonobacteraceae bacterium]
MMHINSYTRVVARYHGCSNRLAEIRQSQPMAVCAPLGFRRHQPGVLPERGGEDTEGIA